MGQQDEREAAAEERAGEPDELGQGAGPEADDGRDHDEHDHREVERVHPSSLGEATGVVGPERSRTVS
jgi:hypothetical protein